MAKGGAGSGPSSAGGAQMPWWGGQAAQTNPGIPPGAGMAGGVQTPVIHPSIPPGAGMANGVQTPGQGPSTMLPPQMGGPVAAHMPVSGSLTMQPGGAAAPGPGAVQAGIMGGAAPHPGLAQPAPMAGAVAPNPITAPTMGASPVPGLLNAPGSPPAAGASQLHPALQGLLSAAGIRPGTYG